MHKCVNNTIGNVYHLEQWVDNFFPYSQEQLGFDKPVSIIFQSDEDNAAKMLGKTAYYDPEQLEVVLYTDGRHPKDVMRSLSHELVHHAQNCRGDFTSAESTSPGYAQEDPHLRDMEREAYEKGNLIFRDFEDLIKTGKINIEIDFSDSGEPKMSLKEWKNNEINTKLMKKWGLLKEEKMPMKTDVDDADDDGKTDDQVPAFLEEDMAADCKKKAMRVIQYQQSVNAELRDPRSMNLVDSDKENAKINAMADAVMKQCPDVLEKGAGGYYVLAGSESSLEEVSKEKESEHYGEDESADKREEDRLEHHIDRIEHHLEKLRDDMGFDQHREDDHMDEGIFAPNHYCVHHGGVQHEGQIKMAEAINHNFDKKLNKVTWYDMKLQDGTILERVAAEDIQVTNATLESMHGKHRVEDEDDLDEAEGRGEDYEGIGSKEHDNMEGDQFGMEKKLATKGAPEFTGAKAPSRGSRSRGRLGGQYRAITQETKISVREAKEITRRIIERVKQENK